ncbi:MAG: hypothetical protein KDC38_18230, partial [Planctomycetes bacterium]|nr:hypothetical protein [Planctomycetota bacterium]
MTGHRTSSRTPRPNDGASSLSKLCLGCALVVGLAGCGEPSPRDVGREAHGSPSSTANDVEPAAEPVRPAADSGAAKSPIASESKRVTADELLQSMEEERERVMAELLGGVDPDSPVPNDDSTSAPNAAGDG